MKDPNLTDEVIRLLVQWAEMKVSVRAMLLTSSRANPNASPDILSDYDVILVVTNIQPYLEDKTWLQDFGQVLAAYWDPLQPALQGGIQQASNVVQYADGLHLDFALWTVEFMQQVTASPVLPAELDAGYTVLVDKDRMTENMLSPTYTAYIPSPPTAETFQIFVEEFFSDVPYVAKCLWRDELMPAKWCLECDMKHHYLRQLLEWHLELDHQWLLKPGFLGRGLKQRLPSEIWSQLESTYTGAGIADNWDALFKIIDLFRQVALQVADRLGFSYPHDLDRGVTAYAQKVRRLDRAAGTFG